MSDWKEKCAIKRNWDINQNVSFHWVLAYAGLTLVWFDLLCKECSQARSLQRALGGKEKWPYSGWQYLCQHSKCDVFYFHACQEGNDRIPIFRWKGLIENRQFTQSLLAKNWWRQNLFCLSLSPESKPISEYSTSDNYKSANLTFKHTSLPKACSVGTPSKIEVCWL